MPDIQVLGSNDDGPLTAHAIAELRSFTSVASAAPADTRLDLTIVVGQRGDAGVIEALSELGEQADPRAAQAYSVRAGTASDGRHLAVVVGADDQGVLYGSYELLEAMGFRFYLSGTSRPAALTVPVLRVDRAPSVVVRGFMPYTDFLTGPTTWDHEDYVQVIENATRLRMNLFSMHFYTYEPIGQFTFKGAARTEAFWDTSKTTRWRKRPGRISDFVAGAEHFEAYRSLDAFGARSALEATSVEDRFSLAERDVAAAFRLASQRGMQTTIGVEVTDPPLEFRALVDPKYRYGDDGFGVCPSSPDARELLTEWLTSLVTTFPGVDVISLWQTETGPSRWTAGCPCPACVDFRERHPLPQYTIDDLLGKVSGDNYFVEDIAASAQTYLQWVLLGYDILRDIAPDKEVALAGWYIEHLFRDASGYLPADLRLTSMTEVDPWEAPPLMDHYAGVSQRRWLINWWEIDFRMWLPQPKVSAYPEILAKMAEHGIEGVIWQHWRTRTVDDNARYTALAMWQPELTPSEYYRDAFAVEWGDAAADRAVVAMRDFEDYERWLCHDLGWEIFAQDWFPPTINLALEYMGVHGAIPPNVISEVEHKLADVPAIRTRLQGILEQLEQARAVATPRREGDRPGFWEHRVGYYLLYIDCLQHVGEAALSYFEATSVRRPAVEKPQALKRAYESLRAAPVLEFIECLAERVEDRGDLGTLVNLNNELWSRYKDALTGITHWFDEVGVGGLWLLRVLPDGSLRPPVVGPDAIAAAGQWR